MSTTNQPRILIVDDDETVRSMLTRMLGRHGYECESAGNGAEAREALSSAPFDLALCDLNMPGESGLELVEHISSAHPETATIMVTGADDSVIAEKALALGTYGYVIKPFYNNELLINIANALRRRGLELENRRHRTSLELAVRKRTSELQKTVEALRRTEEEVSKSQKETIYRLSRAAEFRDGDTGHHIESMSHYCYLLAQQLDLGRACELLYLASPLHDVGKVAIPDKVLLKPGPFDADERRVMQGHAEIGHRMLEGSGTELLELAAKVAWTHHEHFDGGGYPNGLAGDQISDRGPDRGRRRRLRRVDQRPRSTGRPSRWTTRSRKCARCAALSSTPRSSTCSWTHSTRCSRSRRCTWTAPRSCAPLGLASGASG